MRIVVTGASGFIGSELCRQLQSLGHEVTPILRGHPSAQRGPSSHQASVKSNDIFSESKSWWISVLREKDAIIHSAWSGASRPTELHDKSIQQRCRQGTILIGEAAAEAGISRFVGLGTALEYAPSDSPIRVTDPVDPKLPYSQAKHGAHMGLRAALHGTETKLVWCRVFQVFGQGESSERLYPSIMRAISSQCEISLTSGLQVRDFIPVELACQQIIRDGLYGSKAVTNICTGVGTTVRDFCLALARESHSENLLRFDAVQRTDSFPEVMVGVR